MYVPNIGATKYIKTKNKQTKNQTHTKKKVLEDVKGKIDCNRVVVGDLNTPLTPGCYTINKK